MEELGESVWSVVRQKNERKDQEEGVQDSGKTGTGVRGRDMWIDAQKNKLEFSETGLIKENVV